MTFGSRVLVTVGVPPVEVEGVYVGVSDWPGFVRVRVEGGKVLEVRTDQVRDGWAD